jgi:hypothetical protein
MKLTVDQLVEIVILFRAGHQVGDLELCKEKKDAWVSSCQEKLRVQASQVTREEDRRSLLEQAELFDQPDELARRQMNHYYSIPEKTRRGNHAGYKMAVNDLISNSSSELREEHRKAISARLSARNLPTLSQLELALNRRHRQLLKRGAIRTEEEYYLVQEVVTDTSLEISEEDRAKFERMAVAFENGRRRRR